MEIIRIKNSSNPLYIQAIELYKISFPYHEQREDVSQQNILENDDYHFDVICDNNNFIGFILYWDLKDCLYIEHFAIDVAQRNKHYGQKVLNMYNGKTLILEIDPPKDFISIKRKGFYERCGFKENSYAHIHGNYHAGYNGHELVVMSSPKALNIDEYEKFNNYLQSVVMKNVY